MNLHVNVVFNDSQEEIVSEFPIKDTCPLIAFVVNLFVMYGTKISSLLLLNQHIVYQIQTYLKHKRQREIFIMRRRYRHELL